MDSTDSILDMLQDIKDMLLYLGLALLGIALIALFDGLLSLCGLVICVIGLTQVKYAHDRHKTAKSSSSQQNNPENKE